MIRFAELFSGGAEIVSTLSRQLSWSHFVEKTETRMTTFWCSAIDREPLVRAQLTEVAMEAKRLLSSNRVLEPAERRPRLRF
jgi:hypothetical protein